MPELRCINPAGIARFVLCAALSGLVSAPALAESEADKLRQIQGEMENARTKSRALDREEQNLSDETQSLRRRLVGLTARVLEKEAAVDEAEANLETLQEREDAARVLFEKRSEALVETVAALQVLQRNPPPALLVTPGDALKAARASILLADIAPTLKAQADELAFKLTELRQLRVAVEDQRSTLMAADLSLSKRRKELEKSLTKRQKAWTAVSATARAERQRLAGLAKTARSLEQLLERLSAVAPVFPRHKPDIAVAGTIQAEPSGGNLSTSDGLEVALLSRARGQLRQPALGRVVARFNRKDGSGGRTRGVQIATRPNARVVTPFDGKIVFAGPYLSYGQLLIIEAGEGYHILLSGMDRIDGVVGQRLLAGEPVGLMGEAQGRSAGEKSQKARDAAKPHLYFEMRKNGKPFDPEPWLARKTAKARG